MVNFGSHFIYLIMLQIKETNTGLINVGKLFVIFINIVIILPVPRYTVQQTTSHIQCGSNFMTTLKFRDVLTKTGLLCEALDYRDMYFHCILATKICSTDIQITDHRLHGFQGFPVFSFLFPKFSVCVFVQLTSHF
jgi:hypothetical protein